MLLNKFVAYTRQTLLCMLYTHLHVLTPLHTHTCTHILLLLRYVKQCGSFLTEGRISCEVFASECLPTLIQLSKDNVANIRIAVAKLLKDTVLSIGKPCLLAISGLF